MEPILPPKSLNHRILLTDHSYSNTRLSVVFSNLGLKKGDSIHIVTGNHNYLFLSTFAAWYLGASASTGDVALDADTIAGQVCHKVTKVYYYY